MGKGIRFLRGEGWPFVWPSRPFGVDKYDRLSGARQFCEAATLSSSLGVTGDLSPPPNHLSFTHLRATDAVESIVTTH